MSQDKEITLIFSKNEGLAIIAGEWRCYYERSYDDDYYDGIYCVMKKAAQDYCDYLICGYINKSDEFVNDDKNFIIHDATAPDRLFQRIFHSGDIRKLVNKYDKDETFSSGWYNTDCFIECLYNIEQDLTKTKREDVCR